MNRARHGLIIGKFYPPHLGHHHLINVAAAQAERLTVLVLASAVETIPLADRVRWLRAVHPDPHVEVVGARCDVPMDLGSDPIWAAQVAVMKAAVAAHTDVPIDVVFSSESYGDELADRFGAAHVLVDPARAHVPVSATMVRAGLDTQWDTLHPLVRAGLATRIVVVGAESTGTTTVSKALADHYRARGGVWARTGWVPEYGRDYTYAKYAEAVAAATASGVPAPALEDLVWTAEDFAAIASAQTVMENEAAAEGSPLLVCDTDAFATSVWEYRYAGPDSRGAENAAADLPPRTVYLLTDHAGVPFDDDGWRDGEHLRADMTGWFIDALTRAGHSWVLLTGTLEERIALAVRVTGETLARTTRFADPLSHSPTILAPAAESV